MTTRILALVGSLRAGSHNRQLAEAAVDLAPEGVEVEVFDGLADVPFYNEDVDNDHDRPASAERLRSAAEQADGYLLLSPEYNGTIPAVLKNAIDWLSRPSPDEVLAGKPVAVIGASSGRWGARLAQAALRQVLYATEARVLPAPNLYVREAGRLFDADGRLLDAATREALAALLPAFARWIAQ